MSVQDDKAGSRTTNDGEGRQLADELIRWARYLHIALPQSLYDRARRLSGELSSQANAEPNKTDARVRQGHRDRAEAALDRWGAWRGFKGSADLRDAVATALANERERCARIADEHPDSESCRGDPELVRGCCEVIAGEIRAGR